jgi:hypothetical protein
LLCVILVPIRFDIAGMADSGVVVQDVDPAVGIVDGLGEGLESGWVRDVHGMGFRAAAGRADLRATASAAAFRSARSILAPRAARSPAVAVPIPDPAPVMTAI